MHRLDFQVSFTNSDSLLPNGFSHVETNEKGKTPVKKIMLVANYFHNNNTPLRQFAEISRQRESCHRALVSNRFLPYHFLVRNYCD